MHSTSLTQKVIVHSSYDAVFYVCVRARAAVRNFPVGFAIMSYHDGKAKDRAPRISKDRLRGCILGLGLLSSTKLH